MKVEDLLEPHPADSCRSDASLGDAAREMERKGCDSLAGVDDRQKVLGLVTRFDVDAELMRNRRRARSCRVAEILRRPRPVRPDDPLEVALRQMSDLGVSRLAVVEDDGRLRGVVARSRVSGVLGSSRSRQESPTSGGTTKTGIGER